MRANILAIESSCDETAAAVLSNGKLLNNIIASQMEHVAFGGVVPELASRAHERKITQVVREAMKDAGIGFQDLDAVACTRGPGLMGSLLVGLSFAKGLSLALDIPLLEVNHMEAHVMAHFIHEPPPEFPFLCLTVSGGHTQLVLMRGPMQFELLGQTIDDAAGEAFDKAAKMLGLPYPGGPLIDRQAAIGKAGAFSFPAARVPGLDFSFSGIKTSLLYLLRDRVALNSHFIAENLSDLCASYQHGILTMLMDKLERAAKVTGAIHIGIAGGVAANSGLRKMLGDRAEQLGWRTYIPEFQYCTDNAAMIAMAGGYLYEQQRFSHLGVVPVASLGNGISFSS